MVHLVHRGSERVRVVTGSTNQRMDTASSHKHESSPNWLNETEIAGANCYKMIAKGTSTT